MTAPCEFRCVTAEDLGASEYGDMIAYPDPDCPKHGADLQEQQPAKSAAPWRIGKPYDVGWAVFRQTGGGKFREVVQRFMTGAEAIAAFKAGAE